MKRTSVSPEDVRVLGDALDRKVREESPRDGRAATRAHQRDRALGQIVQANILAHERRREKDSGVGISLSWRQKRRALKALEWVASRRDIIISQLADGFTAEALEKRQARPRGVLSPEEVRLYPAVCHEEAAAISSQACATWRAIKGEPAPASPPLPPEVLPAPANGATQTLTERSVPALAAPTSLPVASIRRS